MYNYSIYYHTSFGAEQDLENFFIKNKIKHSQFYKTNSFFGPDHPNVKVHIELNNMKLNDFENKINQIKPNFPLLHILKYNKLYDNQ